MRQRRENLYGQTEKSNNVVDCTSTTKPVITHLCVGDVDEIIVLSDGGIVERVHIVNCFVNPELYEQMWVRQSSGFNGDLDNDNVISNRVETVH